MVRQGGGGGNPNGNGNGGNYDSTIGNEQWEKWLCPDPKTVVSNPQFWKEKAPDSKNPLICTDEDLCTEEEKE